MSSEEVERVCAIRIARLGERVGERVGSRERIARVGERNCCEAALR